MDQFSAHLDRGWDLVQRGEPHGAEVSARRALELDSQSPEAYNLLGYVGALQGDFDEAVESYRQAIALDDTYLEAMLNAAEVYIHPLGEYDEALSMCDQAIDLAQTDDERVDALLLKFDALLGLGDLERAKRLCGDFPSGPFENPNHTFLVGRALYEVGDVERAAPLVEKSVKQPPPNAEAFYYLGLVRDEQGDTRGATRAFLRSRELDMTLPSPSWSLSRETFEHMVLQSLDALDPRLKAHIAEAQVFVSEAPGVEVVVDGVDPRALLLVDSMPASALEAVELAERSRRGDPSKRTDARKRTESAQNGALSAGPKSAPTDSLPDSVGNAERTVSSATTSDDPAHDVVPSEVTKGSPDEATASPESADLPAVRLFVYQRNVERLAGALEHLETEFRGALEREVTAVFLERPAPTARCID